MNLGLINAIDEVVAAVEDGNQMGLDDLTRLEEVAERVSRLAEDAGFGHALPRVDDLRPDVDRLFCEGEIRYETRLNIPCCEEIKTNDFGLYESTTIVPLPVSKWIAAMEYLKRRAMEPVANSSPVVDEAVQPDPVGPLKPKELSILKALRKSTPKRVTLGDIETDSEIFEEPVSRSTIGKLLPRLVELGLVDYVRTDRKGAALTAAGIRFVDGLPGTP